MFSRVIGIKSTGGEFQIEIIINIIILSRLTLRLLVDAVTCHYDDEIIRRVRE